MQLLIIIKSLQQEGGLGLVTGSSIAMDTSHVRNAMFIGIFIHAR